jgi:hypothetical protein
LIQKNVVIVLNARLLEHAPIRQLLELTEMNRVLLTLLIAEGAETVLLSAMR